MAVTNYFNGNIWIQDGAGYRTLYRTILNLGMPATAGEFMASYNVPGVGTGITLPVTPCQCLYIKNLSTTAGQTITVTWTPTGGGSAQVQVLQPGGLLIFWQPAANAGTGISALSLVAATANTPADIFLGG